ncbi:MAG: hypothetical protein L0241_09375 [Planctomycetia bacterium]|nr:hypothetical protein [Planctomycetia bacterium]
MSRTIFAGLLGLSLAFALGCGSKSEPTQPNVALEQPPNTNPPANPNTDPPKVEPVKVVWELDLDKHAIPNAPVSGMLAGAAFKPEVVMEGNELRFRMLKAGTTDMEREVTIKLPAAGGKTQPSERRTIKVKHDATAGPEVPTIIALFPPPVHNQPGGLWFPGIPHAMYSMTLELGPRKNGKVSGRIYLSMHDEAKSVLAGTFNADYIRPFSEPPGPDDAPFAFGDIAVIGAKPDTSVRVTYAGFTAESLITQELFIKLEPSVNGQPNGALDDEHKPRITTLAAGDGQSRPTRYAHLKLPPGRYLLSATITTGGPIVWKWVEIPANGMLTENFTLDLTKLGGVEINAPAGSTGDVYMIPADDPTRPPMDATHFAVIANQMRLKKPVLAGKAVFENLTPGKYEVRIDGERRMVEIVAGKKVELDYAPPKK